MVRFILAVLILHPFQDFHNLSVVIYLTLFPQFLLLQGSPARNIIVQLPQFPRFLPFQDLLYVHRILQLQDFAVLILIQFAIGVISVERMSLLIWLS